MVLQDPTETGPSRAEVTDLDDRRDLHDRRLLRGPDHQRRHLGARRRPARCTPRSGRAAPTASRRSTWPRSESSLGWCAPKRHGFNGARLAPGGVSLLSFDAGRLSCRTLMAIEATEATPFEGVEECAAWDGLLTEDGQVWSVIPNERRIEDAHFYASAGGERADLGPGTAGSLVWCGDAAYFTRDPQTEGEPGRAGALERGRRAERRLRVPRRPGVPLRARAAAVTSSRSPPSPRAATSRSPRASGRETPDGSRHIPATAALDRVSDHGDPT